MYLKKKENKISSPSSAPKWMNFPLSFHISSFDFGFLDYSWPTWSLFPWNLPSLKTWYSYFPSYSFTLIHLFLSSWPILQGQSKLTLIFCSPLSMDSLYYPFLQFSAITLTLVIPKVYNLCLNISSFPIIYVRGHVLGNLWHLKWK